MSIPTNIKSLRTTYGMTQSQFAEYFKIPLRTVQHWESGDRQYPGYLYDLIKYKLEKEQG